MPGTGLLNIKWQLESINSGDTVTKPDDPETLLGTVSGRWRVDHPGRLQFGAADEFKLDRFEHRSWDTSSPPGRCATRRRCRRSFSRDLQYVVSYTIIRRAASDKLRARHDGRRWSTHLQPGSHRRRLAVGRVPVRRRLGRRTRPIPAATPSSSWTTAPSRLSPIAIAASARP